MNPETTREETEKLAQDIEGYLQEIIEVSAEEARETKPNGVGRKTILPSLVLWSSIVVAVLRGFTSQLAVWRLVSWEGLWQYPIYEVSDQAVYNRLAAGGSQEMHGLFLRIRDGLRERLQPYEQRELAPFASGVYAIDGSTLDKVARHLPFLSKLTADDVRLLPGKMVGLFNIRLQQWHDILHLPNPDQNDKVAATALLNLLPRGSLLLFDLGFFSFPWFDQLTDKGYWWLSRLRKKVTYEVIHTYYQEGDLFDGIIWLGKYRADKAAHAVRLVTFRLGLVHYQYITNVLDPQQLSLHQIAQLYARRWDIELAFKMVKRHLKLHLIWSGKQEIVLQQLWAVLIIAQILHAIQMEIAALAQVDPFDVSLELLTQYVPRLALAGKNPVQMILEDGRRVRLIRPSRRIHIQTPPVDLAKLAPLPENTVLVRTPRYAQRKCDSASHSLAKKSHLLSPQLTSLPP